jgi:hypothetical protein
MTAAHLATFEAAGRAAVRAHLAFEHANAVREAYGINLVAAVRDPVRAHRFLHGHLQPRTRKEPA